MGEIGVCERVRHGLQGYPTISLSGSAWTSLIQIG